MNPETVQQIQEALTPLANKLGEGAEFVYATYVRQQVITGILATAVGAIAMVIAILIAKILLKAAAKVDEYDKDGYYAALATTVVLGALFGIGFIFDGLQHLLNPHYYAIQTLLDTVRS